MNITEMLRQSSVILTEGGMVERVRRDYAEHLDPHVAHAGMVLDLKGQEILEEIYREYIGIGREVDLPFLTLAPTWRANPERIGLSAFRDTPQLNQACIRFMKDVRESFGRYSDKVYVGGMMACRYDAYRPEQALSEEDAFRFHSVQANELARSEPDFIKAATLPAITEAMGIARAVAEQGLPYVLSFVIRSEGTLLDGCPLHQAIDRIDSQDFPAPLFYMVNCVHPRVFERAMVAERERLDQIQYRLLGLQANTSEKTPEELDNLDHLETTEPGVFAEEMVHLKNRYGLKVLGGCCGSAGSHIREIARSVAKAMVS